MSLFLFVLGLLLIAFGIVATKMGSVGSFGQSIKGRIIESKLVEVDTSQIMDQYDRENHVPQLEKMYRPAITYEYTYQGQTHTSNSISIAHGSIGMLYGTKEQAELFLNKYKLGMSVSVYLSKLDLSLCVLELGTPRVVKTTLVLGVVVLCTATLLHLLA